MIRWLYQEDGKSGSGENASYHIPTSGAIWVCAVSPTEKELSKISKDFSLPMRILKNYNRERRSVR